MAHTIAEPIPGPNGKRDADYPFTPVVEIPSMNERCVKKKSTTTGRHTSVEAAMR